MPERAYMTERAAVGSRWRRRRDGTTWRVRQTWRKDRLAQLEAEDAHGSPGRLLVAYDELRRRYSEAVRHA